MLMNIWIAACWNPLVHSGSCFKDIWANCCPLQRQEFHFFVHLSPSSKKTFVLNSFFIHFILVLSALSDFLSLCNTIKTDDVMICDATAVLYFNVLSLSLDKIVLIISVRVCYSQDTSVAPLLYFWQSRCTSRVHWSIKLHLLLLH